MAALPMHIVSEFTLYIDSLIQWTTLAYSDVGNSDWG